MKKTIYNFFELTIFCLFLALSLILAFGKGFSGAVVEGVKLWWACVLPSLFPYFFITAVLSSLSVTSKISKLLSPVMKKLFNLNGNAGYALFISVISGYPVGAKIVGDLKSSGLISETQAVRASALCSTSSPMFILSSVGAIMFKDGTFGLKLYACHLLSALIVGLVFAFYKRKDKSQPLPVIIPDKKVDNILYESVYSSVVSALVVGGMITIFYLLTEILLCFNILSPVISLLSPLLGEHGANGLVLGLFECTRGLKALSNGGMKFLTLPIACFCCSFGGLSVIMQSVAFLKKAKTKTAPFLLSKAMSAVIGFLLGLIFTLF